MLRIGGWIAALVLVAGPAAAQDGKYSVSPAKTAPPKEVKDAIRKVLADGSVKLTNGKGEAVAELWFRKEVPAKATPEQVKNGLTYRELEEGTLLGVLRVDRLMTDYRKQKMLPGTYTLRLGFQPMDGDHMGTAPFSEFVMVVAAAMDEKVEAPEAKQLREDSARAVKTSHPGVLLLFPNTKPEAAPKLVTKEGNHWVLNYRADVVVGGQKTTLGVGLTVVGHSTLE